MSAKPNSTPPTHYAERPTEILQARKCALLQLNRALSEMQEEELHHIGWELDARRVLSIGIDF